MTRHITSISISWTISLLTKTHPYFSMTFPMLEVIQCLSLAHCLPPICLITVPVSQRAFSWEDNQFLSWHCPWHEQRGWKQSQKEAVLRRSGSSSSGASFPLAGSSVSWAPAGSAAFHYPARGQITGVQLAALDPLILWRKGGWRLSVVQTYVLDQFKVTVTCFRDLL